MLERVTGIALTPAISHVKSFHSVSEVCLLEQNHRIRNPHKMFRNSGAFVSKLSQSRRQSVTSITHLPAT
jgi:hypothetical protein